MRGVLGPAWLSSWGSSHSLPGCPAPIQRVQRNVTGLARGGADTGGALPGRGATSPLMGIIATARLSWSPWPRSLQKGTQGWGLLPAPGPWLIALEGAPRTKDRLAREAETQRQSAASQLGGAGQGRPLQGLGLSRGWMRELSTGDLTSASPAPRGRLRSPLRLKWGREEGRSPHVGPQGVRVQPAQLPEGTPTPRKGRDTVAVGQGLARRGGLPLPSRQLWGGAGDVSVCPLRLSLHTCTRPQPLPSANTFCLPPAAPWERCSLPAEQPPSWALTGVKVTKDVGPPQPLLGSPWSQEPFFPQAGGGPVGGGLFSGTSAYKHIFSVSVGPALENTPAKDRPHYSQTPSNLSGPRVPPDKGRDHPAGPGCPPQPHVGNP